VTGGPPELVIVPAYNEAATLASLLAEVRRAAPELTVVVIDDGSSDATARIATGSGARVLRHPFNLGYGAALQTGYKYALDRGAERIVQMDADGQHLPEEIPSLLAPVRRDACDLVVGSRFLAPGGYEMGALRSLGRHVFRAVAGAAGLTITDPTSGFQAMNRRVVRLFSGDWFPGDYPDVDVLLAAARSGLRLRELPVRMAAGARPSTLHSGWKPVYYVYKMLLSTWAGTGTGRHR
jgi:glycosyltransferase involved in cell wall biosynthesis